MRRIDRIPQRLAPPIDPQHPFEVVASFGNEVLDCSRQLLGRRRNFRDVFLEFVQRGSRVVRKGLGEK